jgi:hypothetical protein
MLPPFRGPAFIEGVARQLKGECCESILQLIVERDAEDPGHVLH